MSKDSRGDERLDEHDAATREADPADPERREFIRRGTLGAVGIGVLGLPTVDARATNVESEPHVRRHVALGKTGLEIPDIGMGTSGIDGPDIIDYAFDRGMTYFDTAEGYPIGQDGVAEKAIGQALGGAKREQIVLASKQITRARDDRKDMMERLEGSLRRLRTDRIEIYFNHAVNDVARLESAEWAEFASLAKKQGKIRFVGMSGHGGYLRDCLTYALDNDLVDVILAAYNFGQDPAFYERLTKPFDFIANQAGLPPILERAHQAGVGVIAMKTLMGARLNDLKPYEREGGTFSQAAFRWVLSNSNVDSLIVSMNSQAQVDEYLTASGSGATTHGDVTLLQQYLALNGTTQCRQGCGACAQSCPQGVPISDVLRTRMYALDYGDQYGAAASYAELSVGASPCLDCASRDCTGACPYGLDISALTRSTAKLHDLG